jgi:hypothetical protein
MNRALTSDEYKLSRWLLEHGKPEAQNFLPQLVRAQVTPWKCPCGCASFNFAIDGCPAPKGGMHILADFLFGEGEDLNGIFLFAQDDILSGVEVYGLPADAAKFLPAPEALRPFENSN